MGPAILAYWDIRGLAQPIRLMLEYTGTPWEDKLYFCGPAPTFDKSAWFNEKPTLPFDFPNLPYFIDGDVKLTQSKTILRYVARKHDLVGETDDEKSRADLVGEEASDYMGQFTGLCYNPNFETEKVNYLENLPAKLKKLSDFLGTNPWFAGKNLTYADFIVYELLDENLLLAPDCLNSLSNLVTFHQQFEALDKIAAYRASPNFIKYPLHNKMAKFGG